MSESFDVVNDPGLQQERTALAWDRTALALVVAAGLLIRVIGKPELVVVIPAVAVVIALVVLIIDRPRYLKRWRKMRETGGMPVSKLTSLVGVTTVILGVTAMAVLVIS